MKKLITGLLMLATIGMMSTGCKKYEEGPGLSLKTKKGRISRTWEVDKYISSNGTETQANSNEEATFDKDGSYEYESDFTDFDAEWAFSDDKEEIVITITTTVLGSTVITESKSQILRLTSKEFWVEDEDGDQTYMVAK